MVIPYEGMLYFSDEDLDKLGIVAEKVLNVANEIMDIVDARQCAVTDMQDLDIELFAQRALFMSLYREEDFD